jgi:UDP-N-acetylenolpyruvoylglucosamine reductase
MKIESGFRSKFGSNLSENVRLSNYSWFNLGGNAEYFFKANDKNQLKEFLELAKKKIKNYDYRRWIKHSFSG